MLIDICWKKDYNTNIILVIITILKLFIAESEFDFGMKKNKEVFFMAQL